MPKVHEILITFQERTPCEIAQSVDLTINNKLHIVWALHACSYYEVTNKFSG